MPRTIPFVVPESYCEVLDAACTESLERYINERCPMGHFLTAVVSNNLVEAFHRADGNNTRYMGKWVEILYNYAPGDCYGSKEIVEEWLKGKSKD